MYVLASVYYSNLNISCQSKKHIFPLNKVYFSQICQTTKTTFKYLIFFIEFK